MIKDILNKGACGVGTQKGFNLNKGCSIPFKDIDAIIFTPYNFEFDGTRELNEEYIEELQLSGDFTLLKNIVSFDAQNTEVQFSTNPRGYKEQAIEGIYEFKAMFNEDIWFNALLGTLEGKRNRRVILLSRGTWYATEAKTKGNFRGFSAYSITRSLQTFTQGTETASQGLEIQFADHKELDDRPVVISPDVINLDIDFIEPIVQAELAFTTLPSTGGTSFGVSALVSRGMKTKISQLFVGGAIVQVNGSDQVATVVEGANDYTFTFDSYTVVDGDVITIPSEIKKVDGDCIYIFDDLSYEVVTLL